MIVVGDPMDATGHYYNVSLKALHIDPLVVY
jgi:hypothetical protein